MRLFLKELHIIAPPEHLKTSLEFNPAPMWRYYNMGYVTTRDLCVAGNTEYTDASLAPWYCA